MVSASESSLSKALSSITDPTADFSAVPAPDEEDLDSEARLAVGADAPFEVSVAGDGARERLLIALALERMGCLSSWSVAVAKGLTRAQRDQWASDEESLEDNEARVDCRSRHDYSESDQDLIK